MVYERAALHRNPQHISNVARKLTKTVRRSLLVDSRCKEEKDTEDIGACLEPSTGYPDLRGSYTVLKGGTSTRL